VRPLGKRAPEPGSALAAEPADAPNPDLIAQRDRLIERFAIMQSELGGLFYEMAIRHHVRIEVLMPRAAELQCVDTELGQLQRILDSGASSVGGNCSSCGGIYARGAAFCAQCGAAVTAQ
jgi:hypothetical protein